MQSLTFALQLLLLVATPLVSAQSTCSTTRQQTCSTTLAVVPPGWPVFTLTRTSLLPTSIITTTPTVTRTTTVAGIPVTATVSSTTLVTVTSTALPSTDTLTLTSTVFTTTALSTTSVVTGTATSTVQSVFTAVQTNVVPAPSNFIDVYSSSSDTTPAVTKRDLWSSLLSFFGMSSYQTQTQTQTQTTQTTTANALPNARRFAVRDFKNPVAVNCIVSVQPICARANPTTILVTSTLPAQTSTSTVLATATTTSVSVPPAVTTTVYPSTLTSVITQLTTIVSSATTTVTTTNTQTTTSTSTSYGACATSNLLGPRLASAPGSLISRVYFYDDKAKVIQTTQSSAYSCCVTCQTSDNCQFFQWSLSGDCFVVGQNADWCPAGQQDYSFAAYYAYNDVAKVSDPRVVGNGACGTVMNAGQES